MFSSMGSAAPRRDFWCLTLGRCIPRQIVRSPWFLCSQTVAQEMLPDVYRESRSRNEVYEYLSPEEATLVLSRWRPIDSICFHLGQSLRLNNDMSNGFI